VKPLRPYDAYGRDLSSRRATAKSEVGDAIRAQVPIGQDVATSHLRPNRWGAVRAMATVLIRVDAEMSDELAGAFPHLTPRRHRASTTLTGQIADQQELQGVLNLLGSLGFDVVEVVTIPED
jgi:hypothetical protein